MSGESARLESRLSRFLENWRAILSRGDAPAVRIKRFLSAARPYLRGSDLTRAPVSRTLEPDRLEPTFRALAPLLAAARSRGDASDIWSVAHLARDEVRTARVLTWLLDPRGSHGAGDRYLQSLWTQIKRGRSIDFDLDSPLTAAREVNPLGDSANRVDIEVVGSAFIIFVEVKIDAPLRENQLEDYYRLARIKASLLDKRHWAVLLLSNWNPGALPERVYHFNWATVARSIRRVTARRLTDGEGPARALAAYFAAHVGGL